MTEPTELLEPTDVVAASESARYETAVCEVDGLWNAYCACGVAGAPDSERAPWTSSRWASRELAELRLDEHKAEHDTGDAMRELHEFCEEHGLNGPAADEVVKLPAELTDGEAA